MNNSKNWKGKNKNLGKQLFDFALVRLMEAYMELPPHDSNRIMGYRAGRRLRSRGWQGVQPAPKDLEINEFFYFFHICNGFSMYLNYVESI